MDVPLAPAGLDNYNLELEKAVCCWLKNVYPLHLPVPTTLVFTEHRFVGDAVLMDSLDDTATTASFEPASQGHNRIVLTPKPPSSYRSGGRSPSPTRKLLTLLEQAIPPIKCCQPGSAVRQPPKVADVRKYLVRDLGVGVIPKVFEDRLHEADPDGFDDILSSAYSDNIPLSSNEINSLWDKVHDVYVQAERCHNHYKDENAWVEVVRSVLKAAGIGSSQDMFEVNSIQTQQIDRLLLPILANSSFPIAKKADLALGFSPYHPNVAPVTKQFKATHPGVSLSQMTDAYTSTIPLVCGIEVKEGGGDYNEAVMQLAIWSAAGLEKTQILSSVPNYEDLYPFIGWTVIGHEWKLHLAWKEEDGHVFVLGPWSILTCGTGSYHDLFTLLELLRRIRSWMESFYWPWLGRCMNEK